MSRGDHIIDTKYHRQFSYKLFWNGTPSPPEGNGIALMCQWLTGHVSDSIESNREHIHMSVPAPLAGAEFLIISRNFSASFIHLPIANMIHMVFPLSISPTAHSHRVSLAPTSGNGRAGNHPNRTTATSNLWKHKTENNSSKNENRRKSGRIGRERGRQEILFTR